MRGYSVVLSLVGIGALMFPACSSSTNTAARDRCEAQYGVGNCVSRQGKFVPLTTTSTRNSATDTCRAMSDASKAASAVFYANSVPNMFPHAFTDMTSGNPKMLDPPSEATVTASTITGDGWTLTISGGGATTPTFTCDY
ncbi:MAG TPA: hypothetical protein VL769_15450 [Acidimicrobiia bacterium]|nr:hypothetical protein [Acidimicrobiia bacterium]